MAIQVTCDRCGKRFKEDPKKLIPGIPVGSDTVSIYDSERDWACKEFDLCTACIEQLLELLNQKKEDNNVETANL